MKYIAIIVFIILTFIIFGTPRPVFASSSTCPDVTTSTQTINLGANNSCSFAGTSDGGVDFGSGSSNTGTLIIQSGTLTLSCGQSIGAGTISITGGSIALPSGCAGSPASLKPGAGVWMVDADGDGYPASNVETVSANKPGPTYVRLNTLQSPIQVDCYDASPSDGNASAKNAHWNQTNFFTTARADGSWDYDCTGITTYQYATCSCGSCSGGSCGGAFNCTYPTTTTPGAYTCGGSIDAGPASCTQVNDPTYGLCESCTASGTTNYTVGCR